MLKAEQYSYSFRKVWGTKTTLCSLSTGIGVLRGREASVKAFVQPLHGLASYGFFITFPATLLEQLPLPLLIIAGACPVRQYWNTLPPTARHVALKIAIPSSPGP